MKWLWNRIKEEPAALAAIINAALIQAIAYGFEINSVQLANWNMLIALILGFATRQVVVPHSIANSQIRTAINASPDIGLTVKEVIAIDKENRNELS